MGVCKGTFLGKLVTSLYAVLSWACVQYRWCCVSLEEKTHLETPGGKTPKLSLSGVVQRNLLSTGQACTDNDGGRSHSSLAKQETHRTAVRGEV